MSFATAKVGGSSAGQFAEYLSEQAELVAAYYTEETNEAGETIAFGRVQGKAVEYLGIEQGLTMAQFEDLHHGRWEGEQLSRPSYRPVWELTETGKILRDDRGRKVPAHDEAGNMRTTPYRNSWIDAVWAAPKSVSEYMIATTPEVRQQIIAAWDASCAEGLQAIEDRAYLVRRTIKGKSVEGTRQQGSATEWVRGAHLVVVSATQLAARHTEDTIARGAPPDPHLHTHNAISTLAWLPDETHPDGMRPLTVNQDGLMRFGEEANAVVMGDFARRLEEMGIAIEYGDFDESRKGTVAWEVAGVSKEASVFHSSNSKRRDAIIKEWEDDFGQPPTRQQLEEKLRKTRVSKKKTGIDKEADSKGVWDLWGQDLDDHGIAVPRQSPERLRPRESVEDRRLVLHKRLMSSEGLCRDDSDFTADSISAAITRSAVGLGFTQDELQAMEAEVREQLVVTRQAKDDHFTYYTTREQIQKETRLERGRRHIANQTVTAPNFFEVQAAATKQDHPLDAAQFTAVRAATESTWVHIEGHAGSGKTTALTTVREALDRAGLIGETVVVSTAAATAQRSGIKIGADRYGSVESIERLVAQGTITPSSRTLWIIDEAAMMDTDRLDRLLMAARGQGRFVFVGDPAQLSAIGPSGWYAESVAEHGSVMLDKTHRFTDERDVADYALLRTGRLDDTTKAVGSMAERGRVHISDDRSDRMIDVFEDYQFFRDRDRSISADDIRVIVETSNHDVDTANRFIQSDRKSRGEIKGDGFEVSNEEQGRSWRLHSNDSIIFLRSRLLSKNEEPIRNGTRGKIDAINERHHLARVRLEDGRRVEVPLSDAMGLAYSQHANKIQGDEVSIVQVMPGTSHTANANSAYSQLTRAKNEAHIYLDRETHGDEPHAAIAKSWAERVDKRTALSRMRQQKVEMSPQEQRPMEAEPRQPEQTREEPAREDDMALRHIRQTRREKSTERNPEAARLRHIRQAEAERDQGMGLDFEG